MAVIVEIREYALSGEDMLVVESPFTGRRYGISFDQEGNDEVVNATKLEKTDTPASS